ncbi:HNH endonuclease [Arcicella lustrica]|uniref:HNH endonuclease n=1 Tax=Arcicella lustrica TaxID=2984196 RepID=A0ABU5SDN9_9BACT|nr:HNH endonuclease [Arcicella sp. DC25W]MEA5425403.1 HNH endonuclease [Arcicella sp. DC25W]
MITANKIEKIVKTGVLHALYREDGGWYHHLKRFPGALFDYHGYVLFETKEDYDNNPSLIHRQDLNVKNGISSLPNYRKFVTEEIKQIESLKSTSKKIIISERKILNIIKSDLDSIEEENSNHFEGGTKKRMISYYERNQKLRAKAIKIHGTTCKVCQFNFKDNYGVHGEDYIEVHHLVPIHTLTKSTKVNPETDMIVVCSNCHRMIHRNKYQQLAIEELIKLRNDVINSV